MTGMALSSSSIKSRLQFLNHVSPDYLEALEATYRENPQALSSDWAFFFEVLTLGERRAGEMRQAQSSSASEVSDELKVLNLITAYRMRGHLLAKVDPLGLKEPPFDPHLDLAYFKLDKVDPYQKFEAARDLDLPPSTLPEIFEHLKETYCRYIGVEFHYIRDERIHHWITKRVDKDRNRTAFTQEEKIQILKHIYRATLFESFLQKNYMGQKRFSLEGAESLIPALKNAILVCGERGAQEVVLGMAHRGRLNVLANIMKKPYQEIFKEFEGAELPELVDISGDVKYHQGFSADIETSGGQKIHLSLAPNPSHLEFVDPVVVGVARAKQDIRYHGDASKVVPILIHGDSAVIGQGVVSETLNLSELPGYRSGGTIHIVINNQIGFTTAPSDARSSMYCTDLGKGFQCPMFHVNGERVEDVVHAVKLAAEYRMTFQRDVFVDIYCYRKYGHNEGDEPRFTQPVMYSKIANRSTILEIYRDQLFKDRTVDDALVEPFEKNFEKELAEKRAEVQKGRRVVIVDMFRGLWEGSEKASEAQMLKECPTPISEPHFKTLVESIHHIPPAINPLPKFSKMIEQRHLRIQHENAIDWAVGEQLAFGSLILEGYDVRLSGQDAVRGTFSHRHCSVVDSATGERYIALQNLNEAKGRFTVYDSPLSETGVLGFDYGYSLVNPKCLVIWEAQFGDFSNGAQVIIDQFISSAEAKWYRASGLTLLLPHGFEGQGPEHSSARLERYLQLCAGANIQVAYPTTPAQYCHLLRRQLRRKFRKPLVVMTPKSLLRAPEMVSKSEDFLQGGFQPILVDKPKAIPRRVIVCTGKIYWDLQRRLAETSTSASSEKATAFIRMEQLYPVDITQLKELHSQWQDAQWLWVQEEPKNMGAWTFIRLTFLEHGINLGYVGRKAAASPATGSAAKHQQEQEEILEKALTYV